jgi:natural product precursor
MEDQGKKLNLEDLPKDPQLSESEMKKVKGGIIRKTIGNILSWFGGGKDGSTGGGSGTTGVRG